MFVAILKFLDKNFENFPSFNKKWYFFQSFCQFFMKLSSKSTKVLFDFCYFDPPTPWYF